MPIDHQPAHPPVLHPQCTAARFCLLRASLAKIREANEPGTKGTPEAALMPAEIGALFPISWPR